MVYRICINFVAIFNAIKTSSNWFRCLCHYTSIDILVNETKKCRLSLQLNKCALYFT